MFDKWEDLKKVGVYNRKVPLTSGYVFPFKMPVNFLKFKSRTLYPFFLPEGDKNILLHGYIHCFFQHDKQNCLVYTLTYKLAFAINVYKLCKQFFVNEEMWTSFLFIA